MSPSAPECMRKWPVPASIRLPMPEKAPARLVTVPWLCPVRLQVWLLAVNVPIPASAMFSNDVQLTVPLLPVLRPVRL